MTTIEPRVRGYRTTSQLVRAMQGSAVVRAQARQDWTPPHWASEGPIPPSKECQWREPNQSHTDAPCGAPSVKGYSWCSAHVGRAYYRKAASSI